MRIAYGKHIYLTRSRWKYATKPQANSIVKTISSRMKNWKSARGIYIDGEKR